MHSSEGGEDGSPSRPLSSAMASWPTGSFMERHSRIDSGKCQVDGTDEREPPSPSVTRRVHCPAARMVQQPGITVAAPTSSRFAPRPHWTQSAQPSTSRIIDQRGSLLFAPSPCIQ